MHIFSNRRPRSSLSLAMAFITPTPLISRATGAPATSATRPAARPNAPRMGRKNDHGARGNAARRGGAADSPRGVRGRGDGRRPFRVGEVVRREVARIVDETFAEFGAEIAGVEGVEGKKGKVFVSVVDVRCSDDLRNATVGVSVLGTETQRKLALAWLKENRRGVRFELAKAMSGSKRVPDLNFAESEVAAAVRTVGLLDRLTKEREGKEDGPGGEVGEGDLEMDAMAEGAFLGGDVEEEAVYDVAPRNAEEELLYDDDDDHDDGLVVEVDGDLGEDEDEEEEESVLAGDYTDMEDDKVRDLLFKTPDTRKRI